MTLSRSKGVALVWGLCAVVAIGLLAKPLADAWAVRRREQSPDWRRVETVVMSQRASEAFYRSRKAVAEAAAAPTGAAKRKAGEAIVVAQKDFSRYMAKAADASLTRRPEILKLKAQGETIIAHDCAPWTQVQKRPPSKQDSTESQFHYFKNCTAAVSAFQQTIDNQTASLVEEMVKARTQASRGDEGHGRGVKDAA